MEVNLVLFKQNGEQKIFSLSEGVTIIGRQADCDLRIPLAEVSRRHAEIIIHESSVTLRDRGSANGTYVNNVKIAEQELQPADHIVFGPVVFTIQINGEPAEVPPVKTRLEPRRAEVGGGAKDEQMAEPAIEPRDEEAVGEEALDAAALGGATDEMDPITALEFLAGTGEGPSLDDSAIEPDEQK